ncbi:lipoyl protein ligase domain-containing protein [Cyanobium sp. Morenito 9A2]|uniref:lipoate--protein ligase family protein n=1 Tax=Cyanobium sp. Morenito 9A2 TaxID=2823718 RepID=UPI0020CC1DF2|nr:lipoate--protein ligase family protein [Cyanobium sp. Morenito 9A2]
MAIDDWLLDELVAGRSGPVVRLYRWSRPTLSLGWHQRRLEPHWFDLPAQAGIALVRRPSGGRAVLHAGCLTYALHWPDPPADRPLAYRQACAWLRRAFAALGQPLQPGAAAASARRSSCFATSTNADLVHGGGAKRVGSAQLWRRGRLLQHGSLLIDPPEPIWRLVFDQPPPSFDPLPLQGQALEALLRQSAAQHLCGGDLISRPLGIEELAEIEVRRRRYRWEGAGGA